MTHQHDFDKAHFRALPNRDNHKCFGCSPDNPHGLRMSFHTDEKSVVSWVTIPEHLCGWNDLAHGGVISTVLDEIMSWAAIYLLRHLILTKSMTVEFRKPVFVGKEVVAQGTVVEHPNSREAIMAGALYQDGRLCAKSTGSFALFTPEAIRKRGLLDGDVIDAMEALFRKDAAR